MRHLRAGGRPGREADPDVVVAKDLGSAAALGRLQPASRGERYRRWRAVHPRSPLAGARPVFLSFLVLDSSRVNCMAINRIVTVAEDLPGAGLLAITSPDQNFRHEKHPARFA